MAKQPDSRPRYQQIAADLRAQIMSGALPPGAKLPSTRQLGDRYSAPGATIQNALTALKGEGYLHGQPGKGVFVRDRQSHVVEVGAYFAPSPRGYSYQLLRVAEDQPPTDVAQALDLSEGDRAVLRHRILLRDGEPVELSWSYYPPDIASGTALAGRGKIRGGAPRVLSDLGFPEREFVDRLSARPPTTEEVEGLDLPEGVPVIRQFRIVYSDDARPVEVSIIIKGGHLYELRYRQAIDAQPSS